MSRVARGNCEAARQCRFIADRLIADRLADGAVQSATALLQEIVVPILRHRDRKADPIGLAIRPCTLVDDSVNPAMCRQHRPRATASAASRPGGYHLSACNLNRRARHLEPLQVSTLVGGLRQ